MIDNLDKLRCAERELHMRQKVYPRWIAVGRMTEAKAKREIDCMAAIVEDYRRVCATGDLFE